MAITGPCAGTEVPLDKILCKDQQLFRLNNDLKNKKNSPKMDRVRIRNKGVDL